MELNGRIYTEYNNKKIAHILCTFVIPRITDPKTVEQWTRAARVRAWEKEKASAWNLYNIWVAIYPLYFIQCDTLLIENYDDMSSMSAASFLDHQHHTHTQIQTQKTIISRHNYSANLFSKFWINKLLREIPLIHFSFVCFDTRKPITKNAIAYTAFDLFLGWRRTRCVVPSK